MAEYIYTVEEGTKADLEKDVGANSLSFECDEDDIDTAYTALAESIHISEDNEADLIDFQNAKDDNVAVMLDDMKRMGFIGDWSKQEVDE